MAFALSLTTEYQAREPSHYAAICRANHAEMVAKTAEAEPGSIWHGFCERQAAFWARCAKQAEA